MCSLPSSSTEHHACTYLPDVVAEASAVGADVPGGAALLEEIEHCDKILLYEDKWWVMQPWWLHPEPELDLCSLAAFAMQSELPLTRALPT